MADAFIQNDLQFMQETSERVKVKGHAQGQIQCSNSPTRDTLQRGNENETFFVMERNQKHKVLDSIDDIVFQCKHFLPSSMLKHISLQQATNHTTE